ncbi:MAG: hypothetical protein GY928_37445 [Colwellia sp.]|nr:hypothetical protein [Colwellia sp.]
MKLDLTSRWIEYKTHKESKVIKEGDDVEFYGKNLKYIDNPIDGTIKKRDKLFYIEWEDGGETILDNSEFANEILSLTGFQ